MSKKNKKSGVTYELNLKDDSFELKIFLPIGSDLINRAFISLIRLRKNIKRTMLNNSLVLIADEKMRKLIEPKLLNSNLLKNIVKKEREKNVDLGDGKTTATLSFIVPSLEDYIIHLGKDGKATSILMVFKGVCNV